MTVGCRFVGSSLSSAQGSTLLQRFDHVVLLLNGDAAGMADEAVKNILAGIRATGEAVA
jgi:hypothetical protein